MNILVDVLPYSVSIGGVEYQIETDFRTSILFELMMQDSELSDEDKLKGALMMYFPEKIPEDIGGAVEAIVWFYTCDAKSKRRKKAHESGSDSNRRIYSFEHDDDYIWAAFMSQYGIDLQDIEYLHWWKFRAMFKSLSEDSEFVKIMGYRNTKVNSDMSKREKEFIRKMQSVHALPLPKNEEDKSDAIIKALQNGGDLTGLLEEEEEDDAEDEEDTEA